MLIDKRRIYIHAFVSHKTKSGSHPACGGSFSVLMRFYDFHIRKADAFPNGIYHIEFD